MPARDTRSEDREELLRHLRLCYWRTLNRLDDVLGSMDVTARQYLFLKILSDRGPCNSRTICEQLFVTPADVTGLSSRLERKRFVRRIRSLEDRRHVILEITDTGRKALEQARRKRDHLIDSLITSMSPAEFRTMLHGLDQMLKVLAATPPVPSASRPASRRAAPTPETPALEAP